MAALEAASPGGLSAGEVVDAIVAAERLISHVQGLQAGLLADLARPGRAGDVTRLVDVLVSKGGAGRDPVTGEVDPELLQAEMLSQARSLAAAEVAAALSVPHRTASCRIDRAVELVDELPVTLEALRAGRIDEARARLVADGTRVLPAEVRSAVEAAIVPLARTRVTRRVRELLDRAVMAADPDGALALERQARADRTVTHRPGPHGTGHVNATLTAEGAVTIFTLLDLLAQATDSPEDERGIDARRADALVDICTELLTCGRLDLTAADLPDDEDADTGTAHRSGRSSPAPAAGRVWRGLSRHGRRPHLSVTIGLSTLAGLDRLPGNLAGHGAVTAELATKIAQAAGTMNIIGVGPSTGTALAVSETVYRASQRVSDQVATAAGTCRFPSCNQPAWRCDTDHRVSFNRADPVSGGLTRLWDCDPECRRHHLFKTHAHWQATSAASDAGDPCVEWTSPTGHHYTDRPREFIIPGEEIDPWLAEIFAPARRQPLAALPDSAGPPCDLPGDATSGGGPDADLQRVDAIRRRIEKLRWEQRRQHTLTRLAVLTRKPATAPPAGSLPTGPPRAGTVGADDLLGRGPYLVVTGFGGGVGTDGADDLLGRGRFLTEVCPPGSNGDLGAHPNASAGEDLADGPHPRDIPDHHCRRPSRDPDYRAGLHIERVAREAAGRPDDDPPPF